MLDHPDKAAVEGNRHETDPLSHLVGAERAAVDAARAAPCDTRVLHDAMNLLRNQRKLAEVDAIYDAAPHETQCDAAILSVWCSIPRMRGDGPEMLRRAEEMLRLHPDLAKACMHMIFALHATKGYEATMQQAELWMARFPDEPNIISVTATIAHASQQWSVAEQLWHKMEKIYAPGLDPGMWRMLVIELRQLGKAAEAAQAFNEACRKFPGSPHLADL
jgi:predicted RNase H-like HicB family nuclease